MVKFTQKNINTFIEALNHRMTNIENNVKWMSRIGYYMATVVTTIAIKSIFFN